jgi:ATP-dependent exoDNAse (exonuclease V) alpha subunit
MIMIGDLFQLPPVVTREEMDVFQGLYPSPYFFDAKVFESFSLQYIDLEKIYRQQDDSFIELLNAIRHDQLTDEHLTRLNGRCQADFFPQDDDFYVYLTTTNAIADRINEHQLKRLEGEPFCFQGRVEGKFEDRNLPTKEFLELKHGAQVMLLNNDPSGQWVNGSIGKVVSVAEDLSATDIIEIELEDGRVVEVGPFTWEMFKFRYNEEIKRLESEPVGSFVQYPLRLAWAVTIHKSQGKTFSKVILDIGQGAFAHGQTYVALSRCTSLEGIVLKKPIQRRDIIVDPRVIGFIESLERKTVK